jgi:glycerate kinase
MIDHALNNGIKKIVLFIGGSATNDMGTGMACALGARFIGNDNRVIKRPAGKDLNHIQAVYLPDLTKKFELILVCDVDNPLFGEKGASHVYGPQKGGCKADLVAMDQGMKNLNNLLVRAAKEDYSSVPGAGAAGGIGAMCMYLFNTTVMSGGEFFFNFLGLQKYVKEAKLVITGEGRMDGQTLHGKLVSRLGKLCRENNVPLIAVCGKITMNKKDYGLIPLAEAYSLSDINKGRPYTSESTENDLAAIGRQIAQKYLG